MELYIVRHAWAADAVNGDDNHRPLRADGIERFRILTPRLVEQGFSPRIILTSPLTRCRQTADILSELVPGNPAVRVEAALAPGARLPDLEPVTQTLLEEYENVAWVGHMPDVALLTARIVNQSPGSLHFSKGAVAAIALQDDVIAAGLGRLQWLLNAKALQC